MQRVFLVRLPFLVASERAAFSYLPTDPCLPGTAFFSTRKRGTTMSSVPPRTTDASRHPPRPPTLTGQTDRTDPASAWCWANTPQKLHAAGPYETTTPSPSAAKRNENERSTWLLFTCSVQRPLVVRGGWWGDGRPKARVALAHLNQTATWLIRPGGRRSSGAIYCRGWIPFSFRPCHGCGKLLLLCRPQASAETLSALEFASACARSSPPLVINSRRRPRRSPSPSSMRLRRWRNIAHHQSRRATRTEIAGRASRRIGGASRRESERGPTTIRAHGDTRERERQGQGLRNTNSDRFSCSATVGSEFSLSSQKLAKKTPPGQDDPEGGRSLALLLPRAAVQTLRRRRRHHRASWEQALPRSLLCACRVRSVVRARARHTSGLDLHGEWRDR